VAGKRLLIILDNAANVGQVRPLLPGSAGVMVVVTSRNSLPGLVARDGARRLDLDLLPVTDATELMRALVGIRAEQEAVATEALVRLCARLPLALRIAAELAAAQPDMRLAELVAELASQEERLALLDVDGDPRTAVASVFSWSYRHLPAAEARMFRMLGLHPGPDWDRYAAAALAGGEFGPAGQQVVALARAHLIQPIGPGRYGMHDLLRAYAVNQAAADDEASVREALTRLFDYYLAACSAVMDLYAPTERGHRPGSPRPAIPTPEFSDLTAAKAWLDAEMPTLTAMAAHTAGNGWPVHTIWLAATIHPYFYAGHDTDGLAICTHALTAARVLGDRAIEAHALTSIGVFHQRQGRDEQAAACQLESLAIADELGDRLVEARALGNLALLRQQQCLYRVATDLHRRSLELAREFGEQAGEASALQHLGQVCALQGRYSEAVGYQNQALAVALAVGHQQVAGYALCELGGASCRQGRFGQATDQLRQALDCARAIGDLALEPEVLVKLGEVGTRRGQYDEAAERCQQALALFRRAGDRHGEASALNGAGETLLAAGRSEEARECLTTALEVARRAGARREQAGALSRLGRLALRESEHEQAARYSKAALTLYQDIGDYDGQTDALNGAGEASLAAGEPDQARARHTTALSLARQTGHRYQRARACLGLARACDTAGRRDLARQYWREALDIYRNLGVPEAEHLLASQRDDGPSSWDADLACTTAASHSRAAPVTIEPATRAPARPRRQT
jgi:tetratricopeptide (TPR) repeat protein